ncbi:hypothetical protein C5748_17015 [Phyllobacterium phragmitis]|uniref:Uncharacterized protein n=1 Tax=Phyllobacterium phragmitis TaxID=2670329 RepID=A0A2S9INR6_9HYPH|nr:hypothetical protein [Phyllobacterium phragmitis]PRD42166.1 hypothetical protein C5748_17015 [Phyllobacterium phragmitis]
MIDAIIYSLGWLLAALLAAAVMFLVIAVYDRMTADTFHLRKDRWQCTKSETRKTLQMVGKAPMMLDRTECNVWVRIG